MSATPTVRAPIGAGSKQQKQCPECNATINKKAEICPKCGVRQRGMVSKTVLLLLAFFGGGFGLHKFYLRKSIQGIFYVLFFWTWIPGLIAFIEFVLYACSTEEELNDKYEATSAGPAILIGVVALFVLVSFLGILAAIAIPAYQDYVVRARVAQTLQQVEPLRASVEKHILQTRAIPATAAEVAVSPLEVPKLATATIADGGVIVIRLNEAIGTPAAEKTIELSPQIQNNRLVWRCDRGTLPAKYRPPPCRAS